MNKGEYLRVMSFNVLLDWRKEGPYTWANRRNSVASMIRFHHVDVAGLQEPLRNQVDDLSNLLPEYAWLGIGREDGKTRGEYAAIFYRKGRLEVLESGSFWLSETPDVPGSLGWDAACVRITTWARFKDKCTGNEFFLFNTHFDHVGITAQAESACLLLKQIKDIAGDFPVIVTGDFNCVENSEAYRIMTGAASGSQKDETDHMVDAFYASLHGNHGAVVSFHGFDEEIQKAKEENGCDFERIKIDYIFVKNGIKVLQHGILDEKFNGRYPSDHSPVVSDIVIDR